MNNKNVQRRTNMSPWSSFQDEIQDLVNRFTDDGVGGVQTSSPTQFSPRVDVKDEEKRFLVTAEIPGMTEEDIDVSLDENVLTLQGERKSEHKEEDKAKGYFRSEISYGSFYRTIPLSAEVDEDKVEADYKEGMLKVTLPKKEGAAKKSRKIFIGNRRSASEKKH